MRGLIAALLLILVAGCDQVATIRHELTAAEKDRIKTAFDPVLRDPASTQYRWPPPSTKFEKQGREGNYCGWLNAKNAFGAYIGFELFRVQIRRNPDAVFAMSIGKDGETIPGNARFECVYDGQVIGSMPPAD